jgi:hypothetical protein
VCHVFIELKKILTAYFSLTDGCRLLTTDQGKEIRVYRAPFWQLETKVLHPHRFFQHITPIKVSLLFTSKAHIFLSVCEISEKNSGVER